jgi:hypothetical protein
MLNFIQSLTLEQVAKLAIMVLVFALMVKFMSWTLKGGFYYLKYPAAKLMDDAKKQGRMPAGGCAEIIDRVASAQCARSEVAQIRKDLGLVADKKFSDQET